MSDSHDRDNNTFFEPLKQIESPASLRAANRAAITQALAQARCRPTWPLSWWQHRVSVPLPIVAAVLAVIGLQVIFQVYALRKPHQSPVPIAREAPSALTAGGREEEPSRIRYQQKSVYIAGLGTIYSAEFHHAKEM